MSDTKDSHDQISHVISKFSLTKICRRCPRSAGSSSETIYIESRLPSKFDYLRQSLSDGELREVSVNLGRIDSLSSKLAAHLFV